MKKRLYKISTIIPFVLLLCATTLNAQDTAIDISGIQDSLWITGATSVFVDKSATLSLSAIQQKISQGHFQPLKDLALAGKYTRGKYAYWLHFRLAKELNTTTLPLVFKCGQHQKIDLYQVFGSSIFHKKGGYGRDIEQSNRLFPNKYSIKLSSVDYDQYDVYVRISNDLEFTKPYALLMEEVYEYKSESPRLLAYYIFYVFFFTFLLFTTIFTLTQYMLNKQPAFLYYALTVLTTLILYVKHFGLANPVLQYLPPWLSTYQYHTLFTFLPPIPGILFVMSYFRTAKHYPTVHQIIRYSLFFVIGFFFVDKIILMIDKDLAWRISDFARVLFFFVMLYPVYILLKSRDPLVRYIIIGFLITVICTIINMVLRVTQLADINSLWDIPLVIQFLGIIAGYIFFWFGLSYRSNQIQLERNLLHQNLEKEQQEKIYQKEVNRLRDTFFTNITHEFRTPLTVINGLAGHIQEKEEGVLSKNAKVILQNGQKMLRLVNQLLGLSKLEAGQMTKNLKQGDVVAYIRYLVHSFDSYAKDKGILLSFSSANSSFILDYDEEKTQTILTNLLSNAMKFTPPNGTVEVYIDVEEAEKKTLILNVKDSGVGITEEQLPHIFDRFYQIDGQHKQVGEGTGIGLALVKELCHFLNIEISVESALGRGTNFTLLFPITNTAPMRDVQEQVDFLPGGLPDKALIFDAVVSKKDKPQILLVEDNADVLYYLQTYLQDQYNLVVATDGEEGLEKALQQIPDLIVSDVMMPRMNGFEFCEAIKNNDRTDHIPFVLLTAKATQKDKNKGLYAGADAYLMKPFNKKELSIRIEKLLDLRHKLFQQFRKKAISKPTVQTSQSPFISKLDSILLEHYSDVDFGINQLCQALAMGKSKLYDLLKKEAGLSPGLYIRAFRLNQSKSQLLSHQSTTIREVAYDVGFNSPVYFSQEFKKAFDCSPGEFRTKNTPSENN